MAYKVYIVGIGPGHKDYILPAADKVIRGSDFLVGGPRALSLYKDLGKEMQVITADLLKVAEYIMAKREDGPVAVLVSGDPGLYSMLPYLSKFLTQDQMEVIPGVSSLQLAFCRAKTPWQDAVVLSLHGREEGDWIEAVRRAKKAGILTDGKNTPAVIARKLLDAGVRGKRVTVCENLSYPEERIVTTTLEGLLEEEFTNCVLVMEDE